MYRNILFHPDAPGFEKKKVIEFSKIAKDNGIARVLLSIGGGGRSDGFQHASSSKSKREKFAHALVNLCKVII
eukprot:Pgem_evm1s9249